MENRTFILLVLVAVAFVSSSINAEVIGENLVRDSASHSSDAEIQFFYSRSKQLDSRALPITSEICASPWKENNKPPFSISSCIDLSTTTTGPLACYKLHDYFQNSEYIDVVTVNTFECSSLKRDDCVRVQMKRGPDYYQTSDGFCLTQNSNRVCKNKSKCVRFYVIVATTLDGRLTNGRCAGETNFIVSLNFKSLSHLNAPCRLKYNATVPPPPATCPLITDTEVQIGDACSSDANCAQLGIIGFPIEIGTIDFSTTCVDCTCQSSTCFVGSTEILMADLSLKRIDEVVPGDRVIGRDGETNVVLFNEHTFLNSRILIGINDETPFFSAEHPFVVAGEDRDKYAIYSVKVAETQYASLGYLKNKTVSLDLGLSLFKWSTSSFVETPITNLPVAPADANLPVFNLVTFNENSLSGAYTANGYLSGLPKDVVYNWVTQHGVRLYIYNSVKSELELKYQAYSTSHPTITFSQYCGILGRMYERQLVGAFYLAHQPPYPALHITEYRSEWINFMKDSLNAINQESGDASFGLITDRVTQLVSVIGLDQLIEGKSLLDTVVIPTLRDLIQTVQPQ